MADDLIAEPMDELAIAEAIRDGKLSSPQLYQNIYLFDIRITGTGLSYRSAHGGEYVWRDSALYLNDRFLRRCAGLTVAWEHPESGTLNSQEYSDRTIGAVMFAFIKGDDVHGIAKIHDMPAAQAMMDEQLSTSPGVVLRSVDNKVEFEDGSILLIEDTPMLLDHIAIVPNGVWDKGGPPTGVVTTTRTDSMAEDPNKEVVMRDAEAKLDAIMKHMDGMAKRMDAMEMADKARRDAEEKERDDRAKKDAEEKEKKDAARKDASAKRDAEREGWMKDDAEGCEKDDAFEKEACDAYKKDGMDEDMAMDRARKDRRDRMDARLDAAKADKAKADAEEEKEKEERAKADAEKAKMDAAQVLSKFPMPETDPNYVSIVDVQANLDPAFQAFGKRAPQPVYGESVLAYKRRGLRAIQQHSPDWKAIDLGSLPEAALDVAGTRICADAITASRSSEGLEDGVMIPIDRILPSGHRERTYRAKTTIFQALSSRPLYAKGAFQTPQNKGA